MNCLLAQNQSQKGFTLLEVMIALAIFAIGILGVAQMQIQAVNANAYSRTATEATIFAQGQIEQLLVRPYDHADLTDTDSDGTNQDANNDGKDDNGGNFGLGDTGVIADHTLTIGIYNLSWNIAVDEPETDFKRVRLIAQWQDTSKKKHIELEAIKAK